MMVSILMAVAFGPSANAMCGGEAQIIARVSASSWVTPTTCRVFLASVQQYREHVMCPLDISNVFQKGILIDNKGECPSQGDSISGVIYEGPDFEIYLE